MQIQTLHLKRIFFDEKCSVGQPNLQKVTESKLSGWKDKIFWFFGYQLGTC